MQVNQMAGMAHVALGIHDTPRRSADVDARLAAQGDPRTTR